MEGCPRSVFKAWISVLTRGASWPSFFLSMTLMATFFPVMICRASLTLEKPPTPKSTGLSSIPESQEDEE